MDAAPTDLAAALESTADTLRTFGLADGRRSYAGLRLDYRRLAVVIYRVPDPAFDRRVHELVRPPARVMFEDAAHTRIDLESARDRVWDLPGCEDITGLSVPIDGSTVKVLFDGNTAAAQTWMDVAIPGLVIVEQADTRRARPAEALGAPPSNRPDRVGRGDFSARIS